jgi:hypothetical protein
MTAATDRQIWFMVLWRDRPEMRRALLRLILLRLILLRLLPTTAATAAGSLGISLLNHELAASAASFAAASVGASLLLGFVGGYVIIRLKRSEQASARLLDLSARNLTGLAALLAGRKRPGLRAEWRAHLAGESGHDPVTWQKVREARGFVASGLRCRFDDAADAAWTPVDSVLKSRKLSNLLVFGPTAIATHLILRHEGALGVVTSAESVSAIGGGLYMLVRVGRWWRNVKPPEPKARRVKE